MRIAAIHRLLIGSCVGAALIAGCALPFDSAASGPTRGGSPETSSSGDLLYVAVFDTAYVYSYPGLKLTGEITQRGGFGDLGGSDLTNGEMCFDVPFEAVYVYSHGGQLLATVKPPNTGIEVNATGCAFDPATNDLAIIVAQYGDTKAPTYHVEVYSSLSGEPETYSDPNLTQLYEITYGGSGSLFVDGCCVANSRVLDELPKDGKKLEELSLPLGLPCTTFEDLDWDGTYLALVCWGSGDVVICRLAVAKGVVKLVGTTTLDSATVRRYNDTQYVISGDRVIGPRPKDQSRTTAPLGIWHYPAGGHPFRTIRVPLGFHREDIGATLVSP